MVFNDSKVRRARIQCTGDGGGRFELLVLKQLGPSDTEWLCMVKKSARLKNGKRLGLPDGSFCTIGDDPGDSAGLRKVVFEHAIDESWFERFGHIPLPPYIKREDGNADADRYQTVYAQNTGSVAAPTAGLHFTPDILDAIDKTGVERTRVTLHVGLGTFLPVRADEIETHRMHEEEFFVPEATAAAVNGAHESGRPVVAVGTTSLRTLESATANNGKLQAGPGNTSIFIYPGYEFKCVDVLFTNFHTPESTLLMLVSAFAGYEEIKRVYRIAIEQRYRFFSYGDAMLIL